MLDTVHTALRGGDFAAAAAAARALIATDPAHAEAHHLLALALRQSGDLPGAQVALDRALGLAPQQAPYHLTRASLARLRNDIDGARAALSEALQFDPNQLIAYLGLAEIALSTSDLEQAEQHLRYAERLNAEHPHVLVLRAQLLLANKDGKGALALLSRTAERVPNDAVVLGALGLAYLNQRHFAFAEQALRKALAAQPQARELRFALVNALLAQGRHDEAATEAAPLSGVHGLDPRALTLQGQIATERGDHDGAVAKLTASLRLDPAQPHALDALLGCWMARGESAIAIDYLESLLVARPRLEFVWSALMQLLRTDAPRAAAVAARWCEACPDNANASDLAAQAQEAIGDLALAEATARNAVAIDPLRVGAQLVLTRAELRAGEAEAARTRLTPLHAAIEAPAVKAVLAHWLARACDAAGHYDEAVQGWCEAHALRAAPLVAPLPMPDAALASAVTAATPTPNAGAAPLLLWGAPGSGVERVAALMSELPGRRVLGDRFGPTPRLDDFQQLGVDLQPDVDPAAYAQALAGRWNEELGRLDLDPEGVVDWLPDWDARWLPALRHALPGTRLVVALADPRDMLLNWLAFGDPQGHSAADPMAAAQWLAASLEQLKFTRDENSLPLLVVRAESLADAPDRVAVELASFLGLATPPATTALQRMMQAGDHAAAAFPAGHWRQYADALRGPFSVLEPLAAHLDAG